VNGVQALPAVRKTLQYPPGFDCAHCRENAQTAKMTTAIIAGAWQLLLQQSRSFPRSSKNDRDGERGCPRVDCRDIGTKEKKNVLSRQNREQGDAG
jgi:hypothetical protein